MAESRESQQSNDSQDIFQGDVSLGLETVFEAEANAVTVGEIPEAQATAPTSTPTPTPFIHIEPEPQQNVNPTFTFPSIPQQYPYTTPHPMPFRRRRTSFFTRPPPNTDPNLNTSFAFGTTPRTTNIHNPTFPPRAFPYSNGQTQPPPQIQQLGSTSDDESTFSSQTASTPSTTSTNRIPTPPMPGIPTVPHIPPQVPAPRVPQGHRTQRYPQPRYNTIARTEAQMLRVAPIVAKEARSQLDNKSFQHLRVLATTPPADTKFILPDPKSDEEILIRTQTISNLLDNLVRHLHKYDMLDCFNLVIPLQIDPFGEVTGHQLLIDQRTNLPATLDLIHNYANIDESQVLASITFLRKYGQDFDLNNLDWSHELLINSCDAILSTKINERLSGYSVKTQGGPLFLYLMLQLIISTSEEASKALLTRLDNLKIHQVEGENVLNVVSLVRKAVDRLTLVNKLPDDIVDKLFDIFTTSSVKDFNSLFSAMKIQRRIDQRFRIDRFTPEIIFETAQIAFTELQEANKWVGFGQDQATFFICYDCGNEGHYAGSAKCPNKNKNKAKSSNNKNPPDNFKKIPQDDPIFSTPPRDGCKVKSINGKDHFWCHHHQKWNTKHNTKSCPGPKRGRRNADKLKAEANLNKANDSKSSKSSKQPSPSSSTTTQTPTQQPSPPNDMPYQFCTPIPPPDSISTMTPQPFQQPLPQNNINDPSANFTSMSPPPNTQYYYVRRW